jgi:hypothetical protein
MHVHLPKPLHGWRAFIGEVGIIVLGVLIALAAEQTVEWLHWRYKAAEADKQLRADAVNVLDQMLERLAIQTCQDRRLLQIKAQLLASGPAWLPLAPFYTRGPPAGSIYAHPMQDWPRTAWQSAVASTAANYLPGNRAANYGVIFSAAEREADDQATEHEVSSQLNLLGSPLTLTPDGKLEFLRIVESERARNRLMSYEARNSIPAFTALGMNVDLAAHQMRGQSLAYAMCRQAGLL